MVIDSLPVAAAIVSNPTGPPEKFSAIICTIFLSNWSKPLSSTSKNSKASLAKFISIFPSPLI